MEHKNKTIAHEIISAYFGGYIPQKLSDEGMAFNSLEEKYALIEKMELYYVNEYDCNFSEEDEEGIHWEITKWVESHNN